MVLFKIEALSVNEEMASGVDDHNMLWHFGDFYNPWIYTIIMMLLWNYFYLYTRSFRLKWQSRRFLFCFLWLLLLSSKCLHRHLVHNIPNSVMVSNLPDFNFHENLYD